MSNYPICTNHFEDNLLNTLIKIKGERNICAICRKNKVCIEIGDLAEILEDAIFYEYGEPYAMGVPYDSEGAFYEDRFPGVSVHYTEDILQEEFGIDDGKIARDIAAFFEHQYLCSQHIWSPEEDERLKVGWKEFKDIIKHKTRFLFFRPENRKKFDDSQRETVSPFDILDEVCSAVMSLKFITRFPSGKLNVFRAQQHIKGEKIGTAKRLGSPPNNLAKDNRMSPAGISMFYGAFDRNTCFSEVTDNTWANSEVTSGMFTNLRPLNLIDFTKFDGIPSLLDKRKRDRRPVAKFINSFLRDVAIPIKPDDKIRLDYIPTQVVTEYLRLSLLEKKDVHGVIYRSVKNPGGECVVLFVDNEQIAEDQPGVKVHTEHTEPLLRLVDKSVETIAV